MTIILIQATTLIQPTLNKNKVQLKNSTSFKEEAENWGIENDEIQVSYDVVNLYPSIPIKESNEILLVQLQNDPDFPSNTKLSFADIKQLLELCLS